MSLRVVICQTVESIIFLTLLARVCNLHYIIWRNFTRRKLLVFDNTTNSNFNSVYKSIVFSIWIATTSNSIQYYLTKFHKVARIIGNWWYTTNSNFNVYFIRAAVVFCQTAGVNCLPWILINCIIGLAYYTDNSVLRSKNTHCLAVLAHRLDEQSRFSFRLLACTAKTYSCIIQRIAEELFPTFNT